MEKTNVTGDS